ncbi:MAG: hypothetical protein V1651_01550 [Patescibacteria group bacterium]
MFFLSVFCFCKAAGAATWTATAEYFYWENAGGSPFGGRNPEKAIILFNLPDEVKRQFLIDVKTKKRTSFQLLRGERLDEMVFSDYKIVKNILVCIPEEERKAEEVSSVIFKGYKYCLVKPIVCDNWAWWREKEEDVVVPQKKIVFNIIEEKSVIMIPQKEELEEQEVVVLPKPEYRFYENETYGWVGRYWKKGASGSFSGGKHNSFFFRQNTQDFEFSEGIGLMANAWKGRGYKGNRISVGPVVRVKKNEKTLTFSAQAGEQEDCWLGASKKTKQFCLCSDFSLNKLDAWGGINIDVSHSEFLETYYLGSRFWVFEGEKIKVGILGKTNYAKEDFSFKNSAGMFVADSKKVFLLNLELQNISNSKYASSNGNVIVAGIDIDLKKVFYIIFE